MNRRYAANTTSTAIVPDVANFLHGDRNRFHDLFTQDVSDAEAQIIAAIQKPIARAAFDQCVNEIAWETIPSW